MIEILARLLGVKRPEQQYPGKMEDDLARKIRREMAKARR
jgi:hypothetical protein